MINNKFSKEKLLSIKYTIVEGKNVVTAVIKIVIKIKNGNQKM